MHECVINKSVIYIYIREDLIVYSNRIYLTRSLAAFYIRVSSIFKERIINAAAWSAIRDIHLRVRSEDRATLCDVLLAEDEGLATLDGVESSLLAHGALKLECDLLGGLCLLSEDGLGLSTEALLLGIISSLSLTDERVLAFLVLRYLVGHVLVALLAVSSHLLGNVDLYTHMVRSYLYLHTISAAFSIN